MRKLLTLTLLAFSLCSFSISIAGEPSALSRLEHLFSSNKSDTDNLTVEQIIKETAVVKEEVKNLTQNYVLKKISEYNDMVASIKEDAESRSWLLFEKDDEERKQIYCEGIREIRDFYLKIQEENRKKKIREELKSYIITIDTFTRKIPQKIKIEEKNRQLLKTKQQSITGLSPEEREIRKMALDQRISLCERRIAMLKGFHGNYQQMQIILANATTAIDRFLFTVGESSKVYEDTYQTLKMSNDISSVYRTLNEFRSLNAISHNILKSWRDLDDIVASLTAQVNSFGD